jgi:hypothetical protein
MANDRAPSHSIRDLINMDDGLLALWQAYGRLLGTDERRRAQLREALTAHPGKWVVVDALDVLTVCDTRDAADARMRAGGGGLVYYTPQSPYEA